MKLEIVKRNKVWAERCSFSKKKKKLNSFEKKSNISSSEDTNMFMVYNVQNSE